MLQSWKFGEQEVGIFTVANRGSGIGESDAIGILLEPPVGVAVDDVLDALDPLALDKSDETAVHELGEKGKQAGGFIYSEGDGDAVE